MGTREWHLCGVPRGSCRKLVVEILAFIFLKFRFIFQFKDSPVCL